MSQTSCLTARKILEGPLRFGDEKQIQAVRLLERADEARDLARQLAAAGAGCDECNGSGKVDCDECDGDGWRECTCGDCYDVHTTRCRECDDGEVDCDVCAGTGVSWAGIVREALSLRAGQRPDAAGGSDWV